MLKEMSLPPKLEAVLKKDGLLYGSVLISFAEFRPWLESSGTPFFPEYTDHSSKHIVEVLQTASSLVRDEAWPVLTASDSALLCFATLLHDSAMHLTEDGFLSLVHDASSPTLLPSDERWSDMWAEFLSQAARFDGRTLTQLFGGSEPIHRPAQDPAKWELRDRLLIGEFIRRHHARLAHEIALNGVPGPTNTPIRLKDVPSDLAGLAGLIARSHGVRLRDCLEHLSATDPREYKGVHAVFLMALLRVADYLQMQQERAPSQLLQVRRLRSPVSEREWQAHHAILDIRNTHSDPEAIFVQAAPQEARTHLKLKRLLQGLQTELDSCWAVLGEVYGRFGALANLGLFIRRVRSNLDEESAFAATVTYIPCEARFDAAGADLLKLLIQPLYGDTPEVGIRELMQNAVDACLELQDFLAENSPSVDPDQPDQSADVVITLEQRPDGGRSVTVADRGVGMTPEVVRDYFLKAGASFRRSDAWRQQHETETGKSRVLRSGRFGVGALAAFLLGDEVEVSTRHVSAPENAGVCFVATLDTDEIQLNHCHRPVGTTVRVKISADHIWNQLATGRYWEEKIEPDPLRQWDFYCTVGRKVERVFLNNLVRIVLPQRLNFPAAGSALSPPWHRLSVSDYQDVQWRNESRGHKLICNGILVWDRAEDYRRREWTPQGFYVLQPTISVFDPDGRLPLNLQRTDLATRRLPFADALWESQCEDYIAWMLANAPSRPLVEPNEVHPEYGGLVYPPPRLAFAFTRNGSVPIELWAFRQVSPARVIFFPSTMGLEFSPAANELLVPLDLKWAGSDARKAWFRCAFGWNPREGLSPFKAFRPRGRRTIITTAFYDELRRPGIIARFLWDRIIAGPSNKRWTVLSSGDCVRGRIDFEALHRSPANAGVDGLTEYFGVSLNEDAEEVRPWLRDNRTWPIAKVWQDLTENVVIPYNLGRRKRGYARAYEKLDSTIRYYEGLRKKETDKRRRR
jgi:molecular chaperone HtpG